MLLTLTALFYHNMIATDNEYMAEKGPFSFEVKKKLQLTYRISRPKRIPTENWW